MFWFLIINAQLHLTQRTEAVWLMSHANSASFFPKFLSGFLIAVIWLPNLNWYLLVLLVASVWLLRIRRNGDGKF